MSVAMLNILEREQSWEIVAVLTKSFTCIHAFMQNIQIVYECMCMRIYVCMLMLYMLFCVCMFWGWQV